MKSSASNRFEDVVTRVRRGSITDEIDLEVAEGVQIVATVTRASREALGLVVGMRALAQVKASWIIVAAET